MEKYITVNKKEIEELANIIKTCQDLMKNKHIQNVISRNENVNVSMDDHTLSLQLIITKTSYKK